MKLFSFKSPVSVKKGGQLSIRHLAYNHKYRKENDRLIVEGFLNGKKVTFKAFYTLKGKFEKIDLHLHYRNIVLLPLGLKQDVEKLERLLPDSSKLMVVKNYQTTATESRKPVLVSFISSIKEEHQKKTFRLTPKGWVSEGQFSKHHFKYWLNR